MIKSCKWIIARVYNCSDPLVGEELYTQMGGGGTIYSKLYTQMGTIYSTGFFIYSNGSSRVEYGIEKIFLIFIFYRELWRFKLEESRVNSVVFVPIFRHFWGFLFIEFWLIDIFNVESCEWHH